MNGEPLMTMRNGVAGFFTAEALAAGKGIVQTALDKQQLARQAARRLARLVPQRNVLARCGAGRGAARGDLVAAFGAAFADVTLLRPATFPAAC